MWVYRGVEYIKAGLMAEAVGHLKARGESAGIHPRMLRPVNGPAASIKLIYETEFEDIDAAFASHGRPESKSEWMQRWIELSQSQGEYELYEVVHEVPSKSAPGTWLDRRVRWVRGKQRDSVVALWRRTPLVSVDGYSLRVLTPYTGEKANNIVVMEVTSSSLPALLEAWYAMRATPEGGLWAASIWALEMHEPTIELYRVVE